MQSLPLLQHFLLWFFVLKTPCNRLLNPITYWTRRGFYVTFYFYIWTLKCSKQRIWCCHIGGNWNMKNSLRFFMCETIKFFSCKKSFIMQKRKHFINYLTLYIEKDTFRNCRRNIILERSKSSFKHSWDPWKSTDYLRQQCKDTLPFVFCLLYKNLINFHYMSRVFV